MTWAKYGTEFVAQAADADLSDAAARTHFEALHHLYQIERMDARISKRKLRHIAHSDDWEQAVKELVDAEFWRDEGDAYVIVHHGDVFRESLAVQLKKRTNDRERQRRKRANDVGTNVGADSRPTQTEHVTRDVTRDVHATQTDRQTFNHSAVTRSEPNNAENEPPDLAGDPPRCSWCHEPMTVYMSGQTMHPACGSEEAPQ